MSHSFRMNVVVVVAPHNNITGSSLHSNVPFLSNRTLLLQSNIGDLGITSTQVRHRVGSVIHDHCLNQTSRIRLCTNILEKLLEKFAAVIRRANDTDSRQTHLLYMILDHSDTKLYTNVV